MAHIVVIGAGIGGLPTAYELRHLLKSDHRVTLVSDTPYFTFIPSLPWVALGLKKLEQVQLFLPDLCRRHRLNWQQGAVQAIDPVQKTLWIGDDRSPLNYDYVVIAPGASLNFTTVPGLGPETGFTQSVCNPHHAVLAHQAWQKFIENPGPLVVGAAPGASCFGPAYEFVLLADWVLRRLGLRQQIPITLVTSEPYVGHLGIGGMAKSRELVETVLREQQIETLTNVAIASITADKIHLANGAEIPFAYSMILPPFQGPAFLRQCSALSNPQGFVPVLPTYQHPRFNSVYAAGVVVELTPLETTPIPTGLPKTGQMTEAMGMAAAHNILRHLEQLSIPAVTPTLSAICLSDFGDRGIVFIADPVQREPGMTKRRRCLALEGPWVSWSKTLFEWFFLIKMRLGLSIPWFEKLGLRVLGLKLVTPIALEEVPFLDQVY